MTDAAQSVARRARAARSPSATTALPRKDYHDQRDAADGQIGAPHRDAAERGVDAVGNAMDEDVGRREKRVFITLTLSRSPPVSRLGGFQFNYRIAEATGSLVVGSLRTLPANSIVEVNFENPAGGPPIVLRKPVAADDRPIAQ